MKPGRDSRILARMQGERQTASEYRADRRLDRIEAREQLQRFAAEVRRGDRVGLEAL